MSRRGSTLLVFSLLLALVVEASPGPTVVTGRVLDGVTNEGIADALVRVRPKRTRTAEDGSFRVRIGRKKRTDRGSVFQASGYSRLKSWTPTGGEFERDVYLFPNTTVEMESEIAPVTPERMRQHFDYLYRDPLWTDTSEPRDDGRLQRWDSRPVVVIDTRVAHEVKEPSWHWVAGEKIPGLVRRHVRGVIRSTVGPLTNGFLEGVRIRFRRMQEGETISTGYEDLFSPGVIRVSFIDTGYFNSGGGGRVDDSHEVVAGLVMLDLESVAENARRSSEDYLTAHEFAHALGMMHPMEGQHGFSGTPLCSIMGGCNGIGREKGEVYPTDVAMARLAYSRAPGNDQRDRDPRRSEEPREALRSLRPDRLLIFHTPPERLPAARDLSARFAR